MRLSSGSFVALFFVSSLGDSMFLSGLPLYLYLKQDTIVATSYVPLVIIGALMLSRRGILRAARLPAPLLVGFGELLMAFVEVVMLATSVHARSTGLLLAATALLAVIYNAYAPAKYFHLQGLARASDAYAITTLQSAATRLGTLSGIALSGYLLDRAGFAAILVCDAASFFIFGVAVLLTAWRLRSAGTEVPDEGEAPSVNSRQYVDWRMLTFVAFGIYVVYAQWETSSSVATVVASTGWPMTSVTALRAAASGCGVLLATWLGTFGFRRSRIAYGWTLGLLFSAVPLLIALTPPVGVLVMFVLGGVLATLVLPIQRELYRSIAATDNDSRRLTATQWIYNGALRAMVFPILYGAAHFQVEVLGSIASSLVFIAVLGAVGGASLGRIALRS